MRRLRLSPFLLIVILWAAFAVVNVGARGLAQHLQPPLNPFSTYADIFPGQPASAIETRAFSCQSNYDYYAAPTEETCIFIPTEGFFSSVEALISEGKIHDLTFISRDNTLQFGTLERFLDTPAIHIYAREIYFTLPYRIYRTAYSVLSTSLVTAETVSHGEPFSPFVPVWSVTFTQLSQA